MENNNNNQPKQPKNDLGSHYHDKQGQFSASKQNNPVNSKPVQKNYKLKENTGNQAADFVAGSWNKSIDNQSKQPKQKKLTDSNPFRGTNIPGFEGMESTWDNLMSAGQKVVDNGKVLKQMGLSDKDVTKPTNPITKDMLGEAQNSYKEQWLKNNPRPKGGLVGRLNVGKTEKELDEGWAKRVPNLVEDGSDTNYPYKSMSARDILINHFTNKFGNQYSKEDVTKFVDEHLGLDDDKVSKMQKWIDWTTPPKDFNPEEAEEQYMRENYAPDYDSETEGYSGMKEKDFDPDYVADTKINESFDKLYNSGALDVSGNTITPDNVKKIYDDLGGKYTEDDIISTIENHSSFRKPSDYESRITNQVEPNKYQMNLDFLNKLEPQDAEAIKKGIIAIADSYKDNPDIDMNMLNKEWGEELKYALVYDVGVSEEEADKLIDKFDSVAPSWEETVGKKYKNTTSNLKNNIMDRYNKLSDEQNNSNVLNQMGLDEDTKQNREYAETQKYFNDGNGWVNQIGGLTTGLKGEEFKKRLNNALSKKGFKDIWVDEHNQENDNMTNFVATDSEGYKVNGWYDRNTGRIGLEPQSVKAKDDGWYQDKLKDNNNPKYNIGSDKLLSKPEDRSKMEELSKAFKNAGLNTEIKDGWEDYGAGMKWTNLVSGDTWVLSPRDWLDYMNGNTSVEEIVDRVKNGDYSNVFDWNDNNSKILNQMGLGGEEVKQPEDNKKYNYIHINKDGSDGSVTLQGVTPGYGEGEGNEDFEVDVNIAELMDLMYNYMTAEEQEHYDTEPITPAFVNEMITKYFDKADSDYGDGGWLFNQLKKQADYYEPDEDENLLSRRLKELNK